MNKKIITKKFPFLLLLLSQTIDAERVTCRSITVPPTANKTIVVHQTINASLLRMLKYMTAPIIMITIENVKFLVSTDRNKIIQYVACSCWPKKKNLIERRQFGRVCYKKFLAFDFLLVWSNVKTIHTCMMYSMMFG